MGKRLVLFIILFLFFTEISHANEEFVIGSLIPLTGTAAEFGGYNKMACDLYVEYYNKNPKNTSKIRHIFEDTKSNPKDSMNAIHAILLKEKPLAILNELSSASLPVAPITDKEKIIMIAISGNPKLTQSYQYTFRNYPDPDRLASATIKAFFSHYPERSFAILYINDEFGLGLKETFIRKLKELGGKLLVEDSFDKTSLDFKPQLIKIINAKPEVVYCIGYSKALGILIKQIRELGYRGKLLGGPEVAFNDVLSIAGPAANGFIYMDIGYNPKSKNPRVKNFIKKFKKKFEREPTLVSAVVYDAWNLLVYAVRHSKTLAPDDIKNELLKIKGFNGVTGKLSITQERDIVHFLILKELNN